MPPKKDGASKKTEQKKKDKIIEDKTFGLKNKKGTKQQKFIQQVEKQVKYGNQKASRMADLQSQDKNKKKEDKKKEQEELNQLFRPVQTVGKGADPKSVLCAFFKQGQCSKGAKCKFSHDLNLDRKGEKKNIYEDTRDENKETNENWDEQQLQDVVEKRHGAENKKKMETTIICKYFLEAVENGKYGWFWTCPNGGDKCHYRHALPPGFVLKKDKKKAEEEEERITIEELIEKERAALGANVTKVTYESFIKWKERKRKEKISAAKAKQDKKKLDFKQGKMLGLTGRDMFEFNPDLVAMDDDEADEGVIEREKDEDDEESAVQEINVDAFDNYVGGGDMTIASESRLSNGHPEANDEDSKLSEAGALPQSDNVTTDEALAAGIANGDIEIDEDLFDGEDLDQVEEDLETLDLED